ncbi:hypothetical protein F4808DRAFT_463431 [Astrocystis sublimbata]|nr:hypothetical protein F4808DRAFT_463431 [Astrocystis sublimbata]
MDPASIHFSSSEDQHLPLPGAIQHHSSQPPPTHAFRISALPPHSSLELSMNAHDHIFQQHLQRLTPLSNIPVVHPDFIQAHHSGQGHFDCDQQLPPAPPVHLVPPLSHSRPQHSLPNLLPPHSGPPCQPHSGLLASEIPVSQPRSPEKDVLSARPGPPPAVNLSELPAEQRPHGQLVNRIVIDPPSLATWREKLFNVGDTITLSNDECAASKAPLFTSWYVKADIACIRFETYFPHIDNVYSHRSTQRYKRKNFISHYWDCRMKGRPPGTPKSEDPAKKKRKRFARDRDLCDVKIKITEHFPDATFSADGSINTSPTTSLSPRHQFSDGVEQHLYNQSSARKYWTIQRVNGNGGNGKGDGVPGPHKHTLEKSDEIKKSTVQRFIAAQEKEAKKVQPFKFPGKPLNGNLIQRCDVPSIIADSIEHKQKQPQPRRPSGNALITAKRHSKYCPLKLYAASFCPFSQRVWIALEAKGMQYQYCETDPSGRPTQLLEANPRGLVPAIRQGDWASGESAVILEYLEDYDGEVPLLPTDPRLKANCRLWIDHVYSSLFPLLSGRFQLTAPIQINTKIVPSFFDLLGTTDVSRQAESIERLQSELMSLVQAADEQGPYFLGGDLCLVDVHLAPFVLRTSRILREFRNWRDPSPGTRWRRWCAALEQNHHVQATTSAEELYVDTIDLFSKSHPL